MASPLRFLSSPLAQLLFVTFAASVMSTWLFLWHYTTQKKRRLFQWHAILSTISVLLTFSAVAVQRARKLRRVHAWMMTGASVLMVAGFLFVFYSRDVRGKKHFTSTHSLVGLVSGILFLVQTAVSWIGELLRVLHRQKIALAHIVCGIAQVPVLLYLCYSGWEKTRKSTPESVTVLLFLTYVAIQALLMPYHAKGDSRLRRRPKQGQAGVREKLLIDSSCSVQNSDPSTAV
ncbi:MAG: hypothetical protein MHM6MM_007350 [Cercozoa sp. M6MM]